MWWISLIVIGGVLLLLLIYVFATYNSFVKGNNRVKEAFSTMDVFLKKRWDLIPNLVETVKGYAAHEKDTLKEVIEARNSAYGNLSDEEKIGINQKLSSGISKIFALAEAYPDLKANDNFKNLSDQLSKIESDIANSRKYYNAVVRDFNNSVETFPNVIVAKITNQKSKMMFEIEDTTQRENVKVQF